MSKKEMEEKEIEARALEVDLWKHMGGFVATAAVKCAIDLSIADILESKDGPMTLQELSSTIGCKPSSLSRIMKLLVHRKIFKEVPTLTNGSSSTAYVQTTFSRLLVKNNENCMAGFFLLQSTPEVLASLCHLSSGVLDDKLFPFKVAHGVDMWSYGASNLDHNKHLNDVMASVSKVIMPVLVQSCPKIFDGLSSVVDVGGGNGTTLRILVEAYPWIRGINFDLPHVVLVAPNNPAVEHVGGDMFIAVPKADVVFLRRILHNWRDEDCIKILRNCKEAIPKEKGKVIIVEQVMDEGEEGDEMKDVKLLMDITMMAVTKGGKERTANEWSYLLFEAGFSRHTIKRIKAIDSVIEAYP